MAELSQKSWITLLSTYPRMIAPRKKNLGNNGNRTWELYSPLHHVLGPVTTRLRSSEFEIDFPEIICRIESQHKSFCSVTNLVTSPNGLQRKMPSHRETRNENKNNFAPLKSWTQTNRHNRKDFTTGISLHWPK